MSAPRAPLALVALGVAALASLLGTPAAVAASAPAIESESASAITPTDATLEALVDPNGLETTYRFRLEFGCFSTRLACDWVAEKDLPSGVLAASSESQSVSLDLNDAGVSLDPGWEYRYGIEASSSAGTTVDPRQAFMTPPASGAPSIESESLSHLTPTDATLEAQIDTEGRETSYEFELTHVACSQHGSGCELAPSPVPLPSGRLLGSFVGQTVSLDLNSAGVTLGKGEWFYSVTASSEAGTSTGPWHQFEAAVDPPSIAAGPAPGLTEGPPSADAGSESTSAVSEPSIEPLPRHRRRHRRHRAGLHHARHAAKT